MLRKPFYLMLLTVLLLNFLTACAKPSQLSGIVTPTSHQSQEPEVAEASTLQPTEMVIIPTPSEEETSAIETEVIDLCENTSNPCGCLGNKYKYDKELGEIKEEYIGSWHASSYVGSGYNARFVFFPSGNYLFFPSQYECDFGDTSCIASPIEQGIWGIQDSQMNLAKEGDIRNVRSILIGNVTDSPDADSPYSIKTTFNGTTYWQLSKDTNLWNPETGELCDGS
jgi:hypothetical protein